MQACEYICLGEIFCCISCVCARVCVCGFTIFIIAVNGSDCVFDQHTHTHINSVLRCSPMCDERVDTDELFVTSAPRVS